MSKTIYVRMADEEGAELLERIQVERQADMKTMKQFILLCLVDHFSVEQPDLARDIVEYLQGTNNSRA